MQEDVPIYHVKLKNSRKNCKKWLFWLIYIACCKDQRLSIVMVPSNNRQAMAFTQRIMNGCTSLAKDGLRWVATRLGFEYRFADSLMFIDRQQNPYMR